MFTVQQKWFLNALLTVFACESILCQYHVCLRKEKTIDGIELICNVDQLAFPVRFFHPNGSLYGSCDAPDDKVKGIVTCGVNYLTQDRGTNTTTLTIYNNVSFSFSGVWMCAHGSANVTIKIKTTQEEEKILSTDSNIVWTILTAVSFITNVVFIIVLGLLWKRFITIPGNSSKDTTTQQSKKTKSKTESKENIPLLEGEQSKAETISSDGFSEPCHTCHLPAICAICAICECVYCEICVAAHIKYFPGHDICQVQHVYATDSNIKCKQCNKETATDVCTECIKVLCDTCADQHLHPKVKMRGLNSQSTLALTKKLSYNKTVEITLKYKIPVWIGSTTVEHPIRMCGIAFLSDNRIVVADNYTNQLKIYAKANLQFEYELIDEPRGLAAMAENKIAITFPYNKEIIIFNIDESRIDQVNCIKMIDLGLKRLRPFAISYDDGWFAVEVGEGEDGQIVIIEGTNVIYKISNKGSFAYYTGNTIRLALDKKKERVFVSAMSRKTVSCVSFDGNVLWTFPVPSPRSLIFIPSLREKNLILASRRCGAIYQLNAEDAKDDILVAKGDIKSPRYIAYSENKQLLCIQVATNDGGEDLLVYKYHPAVTSI